MKHPKLTVLFFAMSGLLYLCACSGVETKPSAQSEFESGLSFFNRSHYYRALEHFEKAAEMDPEFGKAYLFLGRTYLNLGRWREALPAFRTAYRLSPGDTKKEISDIIMDILLNNATRIDDDTAHEIKESLKLK